MTVRSPVLFFIACIVAAGCATAARAPRPDDVPRARILPAPPSPAIQTGQGSWYGAAHHGKKTASGEVYDKNTLTAAHRTLPFGTRVRVTNAAREIGALGVGRARVWLEILDDTAIETPPAAGSR